jgi:Acetyltransferase (GNAT) domain
VAEMRIFLETERLVLRLFTDDDLDNLFDLDSDPDVMRFINGGRPTPLEEVRHGILPTYLRPSRIPGFGTCGLVLLRLQLRVGNTAVAAVSDDPSTISTHTDCRRHPASTS